MIPADLAVTRLNQETLASLSKAVGQNIKGKIIFKERQINKNISVDSPTRTANDTGDHENVYGTQFSWLNVRDEDRFDVHERDGMGLYGDCNRKAVHIRERNTGTPWFSSKNPMVFSNLTTNKSHEISEEEYITIDYIKTVDSSSG